MIALIRNRLKGAKYEPSTRSGRAAAATAGRGRRARRGQTPLPLRPLCLRCPPTSARPAPGHLPLPPPHPADYVMLVPQSLLVPQSHSCASSATASPTSMGLWYNWVPCCRLHMYTSGWKYIKIVSSINQFKYWVNLNSAKYSSFIKLLRLVGSLFFY